MTAEAADPFELGEELVLGEPMTVFRRRLTRLRDLVEASARFGDDEYVVMGDRRITFAAHRQAVAALATALRDRCGVRPGDRVALLAGTSPEWIETFWAVVTIGGVAVALNALWAGPELAYAMEEIEPALLVADQPRLARLERPAACPVLSIESDIPALATAAGPVELPDVAVDEDDPAVILFTSGTTGRSKGAVHSHRGLLAFVQLQTYIYSLRAKLLGHPIPPPRLYTTNPLFHVSGLHSTAVAGLATGATAVWNVGRFDPLDALRAITEEGCTSLSGVPTVLWRIVHHPEVSDFDLTGVRHTGGGGATWSPALQEKVREVFGTQLTTGMGYGLTECGGLATSAGDDLLRQHPTTVGRTLPTCRVEVRGPDGERLPDGEEGEVWVRSPLLMLRYWRNPAATEAAFAPGRWLRTGDLGSMVDGLLYLSSRRTDLILRGGENVYPAEIENALESHPAIAECSVVGVPHDELGQEVTAVVALRDGMTASEAELAAHLREQLAAFKVPSRWHFATEPLPRTATGKVVRAQVLDGLAASSAQ